MPLWATEIAEWFTPAHADHLIRILFAIILGGAIGLERERHDKPAGFRTIILICLGACIFTIVSQVGGNGVGDPGRVAAQVVTGIGFLGAGAIIHDRGSVLGLTTAATIWAVAAIGMAAGFGKLGLAVIGTVMILSSLVLFQNVERWISRGRHIQEYTIASPKTDDALDRLTETIEKSHLRTLRRSWYEEPTRLVFQVRASGSLRDHDRFRWSVTRAEDLQICKPPKR